MLQRVTTSPDPYEPFLLSQGIRLDNLLLISGQAGYGADGRIVQGGFEAQGEQAFANLRRALEAGGSSLADVAKVTIFLTDMGDFPKLVELRRKFFTPPLILPDPRGVVTLRFVLSVLLRWVSCSPGASAGAFGRRTLPRRRTGHAWLRRGRRMPGGGPVPS